MKKIAILLIIIIFLFGCVSTPTVQIFAEQNINSKYNYEVSDNSIYELTQYDVLELLSKKQIKSTNIAVRGVKLGDRFMDVKNKIGLPDYVEDYYDGKATNLKYEKNGETSMIVHLEDNIVARIVVREGMDSELAGKSRIGMSIEDVTATFGKPTEFEDSRFGRTYRYKPRGFEIYLKKQHVFGYGFIMPEKI